jgi:anti-sigma factor RsiW
MAGPKRSVPDDVLRQLAEEVRVCRQETERGPAAVDDATLAAYAAGALDEAERRRVEGQLAGSPELAEAVAVVREALEQGDWQDAGADLASRLRLPLVLGPDAPPVPAVEPRPRARRFWRMPRWAAAVALVVLALLTLIAGATILGPSIRDLFRVSTERLGGNTDSTLDSGVTDSAAGNVRKSLSDLKDSGN